ncbi:MAG: 4-hydroxy-tetrahydrodipicolinate synthase [Pseudomonadota bacterium]
MNNRFTGIWPALVTPFHDGGEAVDHRALRGLVQRFADAGVAGIVACATTGEAGTLSQDERLSVLDSVLKAAPSLPLVAGLSGINPRSMLAELEAIRQRPVAGILVPPPSYVRPSQTAIVRFYEDVAAPGVPVIIYNIPYRTGVRIERDTFRELARIPGLVAVKDCGGDTALTQELIAESRFDVLTGEDLQIFTTLCLGGAGAITASAHVRPDLFVKMAHALAAGDLGTARRIQAALRPMIESLFAEPSPAPLKAALAAMGLIGDAVRLPLLSVSPVLRDMLDRQVRGLNALA